MNIRNQKGAISLFVMLSMLFFLIFVVGAFTFISRRAQTQTMTVTELQSIYQKDAESMSKEKAPIDGTEVIPIYNLEQFKRIGTDEYVEVNGKIYKFGKNDSTTGKNYSYILKNNIIVNIDIYFDNTNPDFLDSKFYNTTEYTIDKSAYDLYYYKATSDGSRKSYFKTVFYQYITENGEGNIVGQFETTEKEVIIKESIKKSQKYSILNEINNYKYNDKYEFLLIYDDNKKFYSKEKKYNWWLQTDNPTETNEAYKISAGSNTQGEDVSGYEEIEIKMNSDNWGGLLLSSSENAILDGSTYSNQYYFSVGTINSNSIPVLSEGTNSEKCYLFCKVDIDELANAEIKNTPYLADVVKIGDYVNYDPLWADEERTIKVADDKLTYTSPVGSVAEHGNGKAEQIFSVESSNERKWRVLKISNNNIELISDKPISTTSTEDGKFKMYGRVGYLYAEQELNEICKIYGYGFGANTNTGVNYTIGGPGEDIVQTITGTGARSISMKDINQLVGATEEDIKNLIEDGDTSYTRYCPTIYESLVQKEIKNTTYGHDISKIVDTNVLEMLCNGFYWLDFRSIDIDTDMTKFIVHIIEGDINSPKMITNNVYNYYESVNYEDQCDFENYVQPIVTLRADIRVENFNATGSTVGTYENPWRLTD